MDIVFERSFIRKFRKLNKRDQAAVEAAIDLFKQDPFSPALRNHPLRGKYRGIRSIDAAFDLRLLFVEKDGYTVVFFAEVGSHSELYG
jgi:addiction module RelE/StbE family toxin